MSRACLPLSFRIGERCVSGETLQSDAGARIFTLTSCSAELGLELRSAYLSGEGLTEVLVGESAVSKGGPAELASRLIVNTPGDLALERRRLLYDHLYRLQDLAVQAGASLAMDGLEEAVVALGPPFLTDA